ncbi:hypothetical protein E3N88_38408 [Mikania micrantha]|uniref:PGG domain-containing protein n=1 Tax=Mikania micrantha TaxID=192012 RepID=A0A5N6LTV9_9ASTR|nr:hypothetical protein E3N88_38408 [Mikania micrantha]
MDIYNLLHEIGSLKDDIFQKTDDDTDNNMLHLLAQSSKERLSKHFQPNTLVLAKEMLKFKGIESMMPPKLRQAKNKDGQTPYELFCKENAYLIEDGLKWVKSATIYATLMVTIVVTIAVNSKDYIPESNATNAVKFFLIASDNTSDVIYGYDTCRYSYFTPDNKKLARIIKIRDA